MLLQPLGTAHIKGQCASSGLKSSERHDWAPDLPLAYAGGEMRLTVPFVHFLIDAKLLLWEGQDPIFRDLHPLSKFQFTYEHVS